MLYARCGEFTYPVHQFIGLTRQHTSAMNRSPNVDETAAIAAAIERFQAETAPAEAVEEAAGPWHRAALAEGVAAKATVQRHLEEGGFEWLS